MKRFYFLMLLLANCFNVVNAQSPAITWDFSAKDPMKDQLHNKPIRPTKDNCAIEIVSDKDGQYLQGSNVRCMMPLNVIDKTFQSAFSIEFVFKGDQFYYTTYPKADIRIVFAYDYIKFATATKKDGKELIDEWQIGLDGRKVPNYAQLADDQWHHFVFRANATTGIKEIIIDGVLYDPFFRKNTPTGPFLISQNDGFVNFSNLRSLSFYNSFVSDETIASHAGGTIKDFSSTVSGASRPGNKQLAKVKDLPKSINPRDYAPGYPDYDLQAVDQLKQFPSPRYSVQSPMLRNFSWMDISYLHRQLPSKGGTSGGKQSAVEAVNMVDELTSFWNYYLELPALRTDSAKANQAYSNATSVEHALIEFANTHPDIPTGTISIEAQTRPVHAGFDAGLPYITSQSLPNSYYLCDASGKPIIFQKRKWLSPLAPLDVTARDGQAAGFYIRQLNRYLKKPVSYISENGEVFGHKRGADLFAKDPKVTELVNRLKLDNNQFNGWFQNRLDSTYRTNLVAVSGSKHAAFTFYEMSAVKSDFWPSYAERVRTNSYFNGSPRSTPSFYPVSPSNWFSSRGPWNGYGAIAAGRQQEIPLGVPFFAPFVSAGWNMEEDNVRPAQWLALLKSMVMLGADFFHVGYFNITDSKGKWPNGSGPNDPRGYIYQAATPAYAQALASRTMDFFTKGELLPGDFGKDINRQFRFRGRRETELIIIRKLKDQYLVYGSLQALSNNKGEVPEAAITTINLEGKKFSFEIRPQGSMYVFTAGTEPSLVQLDKWHERDHPSYWSSTITLEAEVYDEGNAIIETSGNKGYDFREYVTAIALQGKSVVTYDLPVRTEGVYKIVIHARSKGKGTVSVKAGGKSFTVNVTSSQWKAITAGTVKLDEQKTMIGYADRLSIAATSSSVELDRIELIPQ